MALNAQDVTFGYRPHVAVLSGLSARFEPGRVTALVGPNGSGKSTLLRCLMGLHRPQQGRIELDEQPVHTLTPAARARRVAYVPQRSGVAFPFTAGQVLAMGTTHEPAQHAAARAMRVEDFLSRPYAELSAGQQQRVTLARALAQLSTGESGAVRALLADEPVSSMDPACADAAAVELQRAARRDGAAVVVVLHDLLLAARLADDAVLLSRGGEVVASGPAGEVLRGETLEAVFGIGFDVDEDGSVRPRTGLTRADAGVESVDRAGR